MKLLQVTGPAEFTMLDAPLPEPGPGQILMRVEAIATCPQWDLHLRHNEPMFKGHQFHYPYTAGQPGHEACGFVEALGEGVTDLAVGQRVVAWRDQGHDRQGCYAQYVLMEAANVLVAPEDLPAEALAPLEMAMCVGTVYRSLHDMNAVAGKVCGVNGLGPAGLMALQMARAEGAATVYGFDPVPARREFALTLGADACFDPTDAAAEPPRVQVAVDCHGAKASVEWLLDHASQIVALFGVQREDYTFAVRHYGLTLLGYKGHSRESAEYALDLIKAGKLNLAPLCTVNLPLERYNEGIELLEQRRAIKICYRPWES